MADKKIKIEISKLTFVFVILFFLCILVWTFIIGIWIGTKMGGKTEEKIVENYPLLQEQSPAKAPEEEKVPSQVTPPVQTTPQPPKPVSEEKSPKAVVEKAEEKAPIKKKKVAEIASKINRLKM